MFESELQSVDYSHPYEAGMQGLKHTLQEELIEGALASLAENMKAASLRDETNLSSIVKLIFDMNHEEAGACFARQSNFPPELNAALHLHSNPRCQAGT